MKYNYKSLKHDYFDFKEIKDICQCLILLLKEDSLKLLSSKIYDFISSFSSSFGLGDGTYPKK